MSPAEPSEEASSDPAVIERAESELSRAVLTLIGEEPFFGHLLSGINREFRGRTESLAVSFRNGRHCSASTRSSS